MPNFMTKTERIARAAIQHAAGRRAPAPPTALDELEATYWYEIFEQLGGIPVAPASPPARSWAEAREGICDGNCHHYGLTCRKIGCCG